MKSEKDFEAVNVRDRGLQRDKTRNTGVADVGPAQAFIEHTLLIQCGHYLHAGTLRNNLVTYIVPGLDYRPLRPGFQASFPATLTRGRNLG